MNLPDKFGQAGRRKLWITPEGEPYECEYHVAFAREILGYAEPGGEGPLNNDYRQVLLDRGWTRMAVQQGVLRVQLPPCAVPIQVIEVVDKAIDLALTRAWRCHISDYLTKTDVGGSTLPSEQFDKTLWSANLIDREFAAGIS